jgi:hypothetical protein
VELSDLIPKAQQVRLFGRNGVALTKQEVRGVLFRKRVPA